MKRIPIHRLRFGALVEGATEVISPLMALAERRGYRAAGGECARASVFSLVALETE